MREIRVSIRWREWPQDHGGNPFRSHLRAWLRGRWDDPSRNRSRGWGWVRVGFLILGLLAPRLSAAEADTTPTLDEITIEGEITMPQVLFITAREPFRYLDTYHRRYLPDAVTHVNWIPFPMSLWIVGHERPSTLGAPRGPEDQG